MTREDRELYDSLSDDDRELYDYLPEDERESYLEWLREEGEPRRIIGGENDSPDL